MSTLLRAGVPPLAALLPLIHQEAPVLKHGPPVQLDDALAAQVLDEIPVECGLVRPAAFRVGPAESEVDRAADLLVEQDVADEAADAKIDTDAELADPPPAVVDGQDLLQKL